MSGETRIVENTKRWQVVIYRDGAGVLHRRKVRHKDNKVLWDRVERGD